MAVPAEVKHMVISEARAMQLCKRIRQNMTDARNDLLELHEGEGWRALGYASWRECVTTEFGQHEVTLYRQLKAAEVARELNADPVFAHVQKTETVPDRQLRALGVAEVGTRAEVYKIASAASDGKPTEAVVKAAVQAKAARPFATPDQLTTTVVNVVAKAAKPPRAVVPEAVDEIREERAEQAAKRDEITDDEWIASLPLAAKLEGHALDKFRRDALDYRDLESTVPANVPLRKAVADFLSRTKRRQKGTTQHQGFTAFRANQLLSVEHPRAWFQCPSTEKGGCGGTGTIGSYGQCSMCFGRGYLPR
jgi:hypothetical protein